MLTIRICQEGCLFNVQSDDDWISYILKLLFVILKVI